MLASSGTQPISDVDGIAEGIAVVAVDDANGKWQYSLNGGANWIDFGGVSITRGVLLDDTHQIRFVPSANYHGSAGNITFHAWDQTSGVGGQTGVDVSVNGGSTSFSSTFATATLQVNSVNDVPVLTAGLLSVDEGSSVGTVVGNISIADPDTLDTHTLAILGGTGATAFSINNAGQITVADASPLDFEVTPSFLLLVQVSDSGSPQLTSSVMVTITVNDLNEAPLAMMDNFVLDEGDVFFFAVERCLGE